MQQILATIKALSDHNRLRIILALTEYDELCACQITDLLHVSGATASRHLSLLVNAGLLESRKESRWVHYRLDTQAAGPVVSWLKRGLKNSAEIVADRSKLKKILACKPEDICRRQRGQCCRTKK